MTTYFQDADHLETQEWLDSFSSVLGSADKERAQFLLKALNDLAVQKGAELPLQDTAYVNTIPAEDEPKYPGDLVLERKIRSAVRYNAMVMVMRANGPGKGGLGGHLASFSSAASLYEMGQNHFWRAASENFGGDFVFFQGHSSPGMYARSFVEGRLDEDHVNSLRSETGGRGLPSYPHPYLMPNYWQFPTVSMGLGPLMSIYQARTMKYLEARKLIKAEDRKVWAFLGDGETDEPESLGAITLAGRENLNNLIWVINCNLQRLDGPVRGNAKIIQELESLFRGAGWKVIKVLWGSQWDKLLEKDNSGILKKRMAEVVDGEYQLYEARDPAFLREHFFGKYPELAEMVKDWTDEDLAKLKRGGHDASKIYAAYAAATASKDQPVVILAKTVKGYGMLEAQAVNKTHQIKTLGKESVIHFRNFFDIDIKDEDLEDLDNLPFYRPAEDSPELKYMKARRELLGGQSLPSRRSGHIPLEIPELDIFQKNILEGSGDKEQSTTMMYVRILTALLRDKNIKERIVPIVPDEARTFGLEGLFRQLGIYSVKGQLYTPEDNEALMGYKEAKDGHILEEGINEGGAMSSWIALATSYSNHALPMIPMYIYYSMFGFQRVGDLVWAAGDMMAQGFLFGATAGRTTLNGEGLQHQDGHSHTLFGTVPNCVCYDPCYGYELAVIIQDGLRRMYAEGERVFYYITLMNENYLHPEMPKDAPEGIRRGMYLLKDNQSSEVQLLGSGVILREVERAAEILAEEYNIKANVWSVTSFNELAREGMEKEEYNRLHPTQDAKVSWVEEQLGATDGIIVASSDHIRATSEQIRPYLKGRDYVVLGTDGFGRSDTRANLRRFFKVDAENVVVATLKQLADNGKIEAGVVAEAIKRFGLDADAAPAWLPQPRKDAESDANAPDRPQNPKQVNEIDEEKAVNNEK